MPCVSMRLLKTQLYKRKEKNKKRSTRWWGGGWNGNGSAAWSYVEWNRSLVWFTGFGFEKKNKINKLKRKKNRPVFSGFLMTLQLNGLLVLQICSFKCFIKQAAAVQSVGLWRSKPGQVFIRKSFMRSTSWTRGNSNVGSWMETARKQWWGK